MAFFRRWGADLTSTVFEGAHCRAVLTSQGHSRLFVTFDHREIGKAGFKPKKPVARALEAGFDVLHIQTARNDWFINADTTALELALTATCAGYSAVSGIGFSMGGYGLLRFARALRLSSGIAISPQYSVSPHHVPWDDRFFAEAPDFDPDLGDLARRGSAARVLLMVDPFHPADLRNAGLIMNHFPNARLLRLGFGGHPASVAINRQGKGGVLIGQALADPPSGKAIRRAFKATRGQNPVYLRRLARHCVNRRPEVAKWAQQRLATLKAP